METKPIETYTVSLSKNMFKLRKCLVFLLFSLNLLLIIVQSFIKDIIVLFYELWCNQTKVDQKSKTSFKTFFGNSLAIKVTKKFYKIQLTHSFEMFRNSSQISPRFKVQIHYIEKIHTSSPYLDTKTVFSKFQYLPSLSPFHPFRFRSHPKSPLFIFFEGRHLWTLLKGPLIYYVIKRGGWGRLNDYVIT